MKMMTSQEFFILTFKGTIKRGVLTLHYFFVNLLLGPLFRLKTFSHVTSNSPRTFPVENSLDRIKDIARSKIFPKYSNLYFSALPEKLWVV